MNFRTIPTFLHVLGLSLAAPAFADPTEIVVRVLAGGAKFIGGYEASMRVTITDADTGDRLAEGMTQGGTGDTDRILNRQLPLASEGSAVFTATINLERARRVIVSASGPLNQLHASADVTTTLWLLPGRHLTNGAGLVLELPGLVVDLARPVAYNRFQFGDAVPISASVTMMCGCAFSSEGSWRTDRLQVEAHVYVNGQAGQIEVLGYNEDTNLFEGELATSQAGFYELEVRAWMPSENSTGVVRTAFFVN